MKSSHWQVQVSSLELAIYSWLASNLVVANTHDVASRHKRRIQGCPKLLPNIAGTQDIADMISAVWEGVNCLLAALLCFDVCPSSPLFGSLTYTIVLLQRLIS